MEEKRPQGRPRASYEDKLRPQYLSLKNPVADEVSVLAPKLGQTTHEFFREAVEAHLLKKKEQQ